MHASAPAPLPQDKRQLVARLIEDLEPASLHWLSGYFAGVAAQQAGKEPAAARPLPAAAEAQRRLTVLYGSQTGNARRLAERLAERAAAEGLPVRVVRTGAYPLRELRQERLLYVVISTQGDGDPPDDARAFLEFLASRKAPPLRDLAYSVLALGDSSYPRFCVTGRDLDARLEALGATRLHARADADSDIDSVAGPWLETGLAKAREALGADVAPLATVTPLHPPVSSWNRERPYAGEVLVNQRIVARGSTKEIHHIELSLADSGFYYEPGDSLGVWPIQAPALVDGILETLKLDGDAPVSHGGETLPLRGWLSERRELTRLTQPLVAAQAERGGHDALRALLGAEAREALSRFLATQQPIDLLRRYPAAWDAAPLVAALRPLAPRLYSIASSRKEVGDEAHLTVAHLHYLEDGDPRWGVASHHLAALGEGARLPVFLESNERFRLPQDGSRDIIMIGPGTGVAPFRAFVQERQAVGATGRSWLFFGNPHRRTDFLYQLEWQAALKSGALTRLDVAFSRDQDRKVYVQHRLREHGRELYAWLEAGAHLYVCGDASGMARDVHAALLDIAATHGGKDPDSARGWLDNLLAAGRYSRDIY